MENPFKILGLSPSIARKLKDDELMQIAKKQYKALQLIYHPDRGGSVEDSQRLNEAMALLEKPENFAVFRAQYAARGSRPAQALTEVQGRFTRVYKDLNELKEKFGQTVMEWAASDSGTCRLVPVLEKELFLHVYPKIPSPEKGSHVGRALKIEKNRRICEYDILNERFHDTGRFIVGGLEYTPVIKSLSPNPTESNDVAKMLESKAVSDVVSRKDFEQNYAAFLRPLLAGRSLIDIVTCKERNQKAFIVEGSIATCSANLGDIIGEFAHDILKYVMHIPDKSIKWGDLSENEKALETKDYRDKSTKIINLLRKAAKKYGCSNAHEMVIFADEVAKAAVANYLGQYQWLGSKERKHAREIYENQIGYNGKKKILEYLISRK